MMTYNEPKLVGPISWLCEIVCNFFIKYISLVTLREKIVLGLKDLTLSVSLLS